jgi:hypothetical protein
MCSATEISDLTSGHRSPSGMSQPRRERQRSPRRAVFFETTRNSAIHAIDSSSRAFGNFREHGRASRDPSGNGIRDLTVCDFGQPLMRTELIPLLAIDRRDGPSRGDPPSDQLSRWTDLQKGMNSQCPRFWPTRLDRRRPGWSISEEGSAVQLHSIGQKSSVTPRSRKLQPPSQ